MPSPGEFEGRAQAQSVLSRLAGERLHAREELDGEPRGLGIEFHFGVGVEGVPVVAVVGIVVPGKGRVSEFVAQMEALPLGGLLAIEIDHMLADIQRPKDLVLEHDESRPEPDRQRAEVEQIDRGSEPERLGDLVDGDRDHAKHIRLPQRATRVAADAVDSRVVTLHRACLVVGDGDNP